MKILYGVQGTGNGHITRSLIMAKELAKAGHEVQFLFSGRPKDKYFSMKDFGDPIYKKGLTFVIANGKVDLWKTLSQNDFSTLLREIDHLDLSGYDFVISDYEPITAWAARLQKKFCLGIGHQYAFDFDIPKSHNNFITDYVMKMFAPVSKGIGLHWHHFDQPILPPIFEHHKPKPGDGSILVYLPFESPESIIHLFSNFPNNRFLVYGHGAFDSQTNNIAFYKSSKDVFLQRLIQCSGVICNAGFELASEALSLGKKLLVKPVHGQMEQHSNALAMTLQGLGLVSNSLHPADVEIFLRKTKAVKITYPNVATYIVKNLSCIEQIDTKSIWNDVQITQVSI